MGEAVCELTVYSSSKVENNKICLMIAAGHPTRFGGCIRKGRKVREGVWEHTSSGNFSS